MQSDLELRQSLQIAHVVRAQLAKLSIKRLLDLARQANNLLTETQRISLATRRLSLAAAHEWPVAAETAARQLESATGGLEFYVGQVASVAEHRHATIPPVREVLEDLAEIKEEFGGYRYDRDSQTLAVTIEPIELEGVYLGEFEIALRLDSLADAQWDRCFSIIAQDPHPAGGNPHITHPHVSDGKLCAGDAVGPIRLALSGGRLTDFVQIVYSVLNTYNPDSPYISLDNWHGVSCYSCGYSTHPEETRWCESCQQDHCDDCASYCHVCDETTCLSCLSPCSVCDDPTCPSCFTTCPDCGDRLCSRCLDDGQCPCREENEDEQDPATPKPPETIKAAG